MRGGASTESALALAELCYRILLRDGAAALAALQTRTPAPALERLVEANTLLSGLGFESSGLAAAHAVHNGLTAVPQTHPYYHGEKVAYGVLVQLVLEQKPQALVEEVLEFATKVGLPRTLAAIGLAEMTGEALAQIAARTTAEGETIHNEPFGVEPKMVAEAIRTADALGREWNRKHGLSAAG
jgi:glycerol dehydrogenase